MPPPPRIAVSLASIPPASVGPAGYSGAEPLGAVCAALLEALPVGVALFGADDALVRANPAFESLCAASVGGVPASLGEALAPGGADLERALRRARGGERAGPVCVPFGGDGAPRLLDVSLLPLALPDGARGVALVLVPMQGPDAPDVLADVDALLAEQAQRARERRLAAVGQLAAGVMHDVNNALSPIVAAAHLLEMHAHDPVQVRDYARRIARAAETGAATAARVGRFIRQEPIAEGVQRYVDLAGMAEEVVQLTRSMWAERAGGGTVRLAFDCLPGLVVRGNVGELREALLNLVQNALDAMQGGGVLGVRTAVAGDEVTLEVCDTGAGMSAEVRERAFEPFFTTKGVRGTGLGLSEVYGIMKRHRGRVELDSAPGQGTIVRLVFPRSAGTYRPSGDFQAIAAGGRPPRRVLLVEDHDDGREFMRTLLASDGHRVDAVGTFDAARDRLAHQCPYDVMVTDLGLPDGSGRQLVTEARTHWPRLRVGIVTGWEPTVWADALPAHFTLRKPVRALDLLTHVCADV